MNAGALPGWSGSKHRGKGVKDRRPDIMNCPIMVKGGWKGLVPAERGSSDYPLARGIWIVSRSRTGGRKKNRHGEERWKVARTRG